jgi:arsenite methyltransferase
MADITVDTVDALRRHNADYGVDGSFHTTSPRAQAAFVAGVVAALTDTTVHLAKRRNLAATVAGAADAAVIATAAFYLHTTRAGKFAAWARVLGDLGLRGDETLLDLGCGRGAVLLAAAKLLPRGRAIGVDVWRADQTGDSPQQTLENAALESVAERVEVRTADITELPFGDDSVDVVVSSLVIHNLGSRAAREQAIREAARVLRPGGRLAIADLWATSQHARQLQRMGWSGVQRRNLGWRMWWGPWLSTHLVWATKPAA